MPIPEAQIREILDRTDLVELVNEVVPLTKKGDRYWACCPFHNEKTPSFSVSRDKGFFYCFGCQKHGNAPGFLMELEGLTFPEAMYRLAEKAGIRIEEESGGQNQALRDKRDALYTLYDKLSNTFHYLLTQKEVGRPALEYLHGRGIRDYIIEEFRLGYCPEERYWLHGYLRQKGYSDEFLADSGLFSKRNPRFAIFAGRVVFSIRDKQGRSVAFGGRILGEGEPKYLNSPETPIFKKRETLYGFDAARREMKAAGEFVLVEGYLDVLAFHQAGVRQAVAPLGTAFTPEQARVLKRSAGKGVLVFDSDSAGQEASRKAAIVLERSGIVPVVASPEGGKDPAEMLQIGGDEALHKLVKYPINSFDYLLNAALRAHDARRPEGKEAVLGEIVPYINSIESAVRKEGYLKILSEKLDVSLASISRDLGKRTENTAPPEVIPSRTAPVHRGDLGHELYLLMATTLRKEDFALVRSLLTLEDLVDPRARELFLLLENAFREDRFSTENIYREIREDSLREALAEKAVSGEFDEERERVIRDAVRMVKVRALEKNLKGLSSRIAYLENEGGDRGEIESLVVEKMALDGELQKLRVVRDE
jgi:DNA primase